MKAALKLATLIVLCLGLASVDADAKRLGGRNVGAQRAAPTQVQKQAAPTNPQTAAAPAAAGGRWFGPVAGLLAGLGLGALLMHTGMGGAFGLVLVVLLGVVLASMLVRRFLRPAPGPVHGPLRYAGPTPGLHMP